ncbi:hypothetical protein [Verrucomicrobium spinosum]|uniref:hypothetical protein n=1 Tax=Verrucomicrobium spinosum TaxID=2736 RepID=UPI0009463609|nr:hypothetical protein [Verrucomicrobium spinosum]
MKLLATNTVEAVALLTNEASAEASTFHGSESTSAGFVLASNMIAGGSTAVLANTTAPVLALGAVEISAEDKLTLDAVVKLVVESSSGSTNPFSKDGAKAIGGLAVRNDLIGGGAAELTNVNLAGASVVVRSSESSVMDASVDAEFSADSGGLDSGISLAVGA